MPGAPRTRSEPWAVAVKLLGAVTLAVLVGGGVAAANGVLPNGMQDFASTQLAKVGFRIPALNHDTARTDLPAAGPEAPSSGTPAAATAPDAAPGGATDHAATVTSIAHDPGLSGVDKGAAVSTAASGGTSAAGTHGTAGSPSPGGAGTGANTGSSTTHRVSPTTTVPTSAANGAHTTQRP